VAGRILPLTSGRQQPSLLGLELLRAEDPSRLEVGKILQCSDAIRRRRGSRRRRRSHGSGGGLVGGLLVGGFRSGLCLTVGTSGRPGDARRDSTRRLRSLRRRRSERPLSLNPGMIFSFVTVWRMCRVSGVCDVEVRRRALRRSGKERLDRDAAVGDELGAVGDAALGRMGRPTCSRRRESQQNSRARARNPPRPHRRRRAAPMPRRRTA
jgi:hypothetical protein